MKDYRVVAILCSYDIINATGSINREKPNESSTDDCGLTIFVPIEERAWSTRADPFQDRSRSRRKEIARLLTSWACLSLSLVEYSERQVQTVAPLSRNASIYEGCNVQQGTPRIILRSHADSNSAREIEYSRTTVPAVTHPWSQNWLPWMN